jgi:hypothetical protein
MGESYNLVSKLRVSWERASNDQDLGGIAVLEVRTNNGIKHAISLINDNPLGTLDDSQIQKTEGVILLESQFKELKIGPDHHICKDNRP